jgi:hypothetical protein
MTQIFESLTLTISKREYTELTRKAFAFDAYSKVVTNTINRGGYVTDMERGLFYKEEAKEEIKLVPEEPEEEGMAEFFTDEEWQKVVEIVEAEKE